MSTHVVLGQFNIKVYVGIRAVHRVDNESFTVSAPLLLIIVNKALFNHGFDQQRLIWYVFRLWDMVCSCCFER